MTTALTAKTVSNNDADNAKTPTVTMHLYIYIISQPTRCPPAVENGETTEVKGEDMVVVEKVSSFDKK